ncbi:MAG TPA: YggT family protein [Polyangiaceae bacterium]|nr:YggT family protein [Polyangiaceae bacterium]
MFLISLLCDVYSFVLFVAVILSWLRLPEDNQIVVLIHRWTEPVLEPIRRILPPLGGLDFSPFIALIGLRLIERLLLRI